MGILTKIALRYLVSKKTHNAVNIISTISTLGVVVTTAAIICVLSVFNGFRGLIMGKLAQLDPQVAVMAKQGKAIEQADSVLRVVQAVPGVQAAIPVIEDHALAVFASYQMPVRLRGVPDNYDRLHPSMDTLMVDGRWMLHDQVSTYAVLGVGPAITLNARPGYLTMLNLYAPKRQGRVNLSNPMGAFVADSLFVGGVFQLQQNAYDADLIFVPIDMARHLFDYPTQATQIEVILQLGADEAACMAQLAQRLGPAYTIQNRLMQQSAAYRLVNVEKWMAFLLMAFILLIATFNVISTLSLLIIEKDESIGTLRSLGATDQQITRIFVIEGWLIALLGAVLGVTLGLALCYGQQHYGWLTVGQDPSSLVVHAYPVVVQAGDVAIAFALVAGIGLLTALVTSLVMRRRLGRASSR